MSCRLDQFLGKRSFRDYHWMGATVAQGDPREDGAVELLLKQGLPAGEKLAFVNFGCGAYANRLGSTKALALHAFWSDHLVCEKNLPKASRVVTPARLLADQSIAKEIRSCNVVLLRLFRDMAFNWDWISALSKVMAPSAELHVIGGNDDGVKSVEKRITQWNVQCAQIAVGCHSRWIMVKAESLAGKVLELSGQKKMDIKTPQGVFSMQVPEGVFSANHLDQGTSLLLENLGEVKNKTVWDFGCGSGVVALSALASGAIKVFASDNSSVAVDCTKQNLASQSPQANVGLHFLDDGIEASFDCILTNPPFHLEAKEIRDFGRIWLMACLARLNPGGEIRVVCNAFLPYSQFASELGCNASEVAQSKGFKVWKIVKKNG